VLRGFVDEITAEAVCGWALDDADLKRTVNVEVVVNGVQYASPRADVLREDLQREFGCGHHAFAFEFRPPLSIIRDQHIRIRYSGTDQIVPNGECMLPGGGDRNMDQESPLTRVLGGGRSDPPQRYLGNYRRYLAQGGELSMEQELAAFTHGGANRTDMARFYFFCLAFDQIVKEGLYGHFAELGVYKGHTGGLLANFARRLDRTVYLLDTYEGFSHCDLTGIDADAEASSFADTSLAAVRSVVGESNVRFVKGYFPDTAAELPADGTYCLVHIDCDLYAPMASALEYFYPRMVPGGFIIAHDYSSLHWKGAEKAVDEFFSGRPECPIPMPDGAGSVAIRRARTPGRTGSWIDDKRRTLLRTEWSTPVGGRLAELLYAGWSGPEPWGVWGVGEEHVLRLTPPTERVEPFKLELDVQAALTELHVSQTVSVAIDGDAVAEWRFELGRNRGLRKLTIPRPAPGRVWVDIAFRPEIVLPASEMRPGSDDQRTLGLGLIRIRRSEDESAA
jgi:hypothetical protein